MPFTSLSSSILAKAMSNIAQRATPMATLAVISSAAFLLGVLFSNWPWDYHVLWAREISDKDLESVIAHYVKWLESPKYMPYTMYGVLIFGIFGSVIKCAQPAADIAYVEYGTLGAYALSACIYVSNVRFGVLSAQVGEWGDYDAVTCMSVVAASETMIVFFLLGIVLIQCALFYAKYEDDRVKHEFLMNELHEKLAKADKKQ